jgi:hypothetical protein
MGDLRVDGRIILKWILKKRCEDVDWHYIQAPALGHSVPASYESLGVY